MFSDLYAELLKNLKSSFKDIPVFDSYPEAKRLESVPAIFFEMTDFEPVNDPMTGEIDFETRWEGRVICGPKPGSQIEARDICAKMALSLNKKSFVSNADPIKIIRCTDDNFDRRVAGYEVWVCEWSQVIRLGKNNWDQIDLYPETRMQDHG